MKDWQDKEQIYCARCNHRWILISNRMITQVQHNFWVESVWKQHAQIRKEKEQ